MVDMTELKLIGEFNCWNCNKPIKIDSNVGVCNRLVWNKERKKCPHCNSWNIITVDIRLTGASENEVT